MFYSHGSFHRARSSSHHPTIGADTGLHRRLLRRGAGGARRPRRRSRRRRRSGTGSGCTRTGTAASRCAPATCRWTPPASRHACPTASAPSAATSPAWTTCRPGPLLPGPYQPPPPRPKADVRDDASYHFMLLLVSPSIVFSTATLYLCKRNLPLLRLGAVDPLVHCQVEPCWRPCALPTQRGLVFLFGKYQFDFSANAIFGSNSEILEE